MLEIRLRDKGWELGSEIRTVYFTSLGPYILCPRDRNIMTHYYLEGPYILRPKVKVYFKSLI